MSKQATTVRQSVIIACLAAISYLLMFFHFPIIPIVPWMSIDFADVPILLGFFALGGFGGSMIAIVRSVLYLVIKGLALPSIIGVGSNLLATFALCLPIYFLLKDKQPKLFDYFRAIAAGTVSLTFFLSLANWTVITPVYMAVLGLKINVPLPTLILTGVVPFNLIKGILVGTVFSLIYVNLYHWINKKHRQFL
ncbi:ECF transporter S component [Ligilactobacillus equi]